LYHKDNKACRYGKNCEPYHSIYKTFNYFLRTDYLSLICSTASVFKSIQRKL